MQWISWMLLKEDSFIDENGKNIPLSHYDIEFKNVDFGYDSRQVLKNVSFSIPEKTSTAIVGPSGSGKTTICSLLARFYDPNSGSITVGGHDLREMTCDSLLSNISMVFQNVYLFNDTIRANICFGKPDATEEEMIAAAKKARCHDFISALPQGYDTVIGEGGEQLFQAAKRQSISIARAILKNAPIIILRRSHRFHRPRKRASYPVGNIRAYKGQDRSSPSHIVSQRYRARRSRYL